METLFVWDEVCGFHQSQEPTIYPESKSVELETNEVGREGISHCGVRRFDDDGSLMITEAEICPNMKEDIAASLQKALGTNLDMSTAYRPQTDGQSERTNAGRYVACLCIAMEGRCAFRKAQEVKVKFIGPFKIVARVGPVAYTLELPKELKGIHIAYDEEPVEIVDKEVKRLKQSRIPIVKVRWNSQRGPEFTWEREDQIKKKYPHLFTSKDKAMRVDETS
ncbi:putative reverse transcriptase domain-containing protein [Tanacetum coccineum]